MSVHDACEAWAEGRLPIERALELTGAADVGELLIICYQCEVPRPLLTGPPPAEEGYPPESEARYPSEDGPGASGPGVELTVRVLVGNERSTIVVADAVTGQALEHDVVQHGGEAGAASMAVYTALKKREAGL